MLEFTALPISPVPHNTQERTGGRNTPAECSKVGHTNSTSTSRKKKLTERSFLIYHHLFLTPGPFPSMACTRSVSRIITRMPSTIVGQSGRKYIQSSVLQRHPKRPELSIYQARYLHLKLKVVVSTLLCHIADPCYFSCGSESFVVKRVSDSISTLSQTPQKRVRGTQSPSDAYRSQPRGAYISVQVFQTHPACLGQRASRLSRGGHQENNTMHSRGN